MHGELESARIARKLTRQPVPFWSGFPGDIWPARGYYSFILVGRLSSLPESKLIILKIGKWE